MERVLESKTNFKKIVNGICSTYKLNPDIEQTIIDIKSFLKPIDSKLLLKKYNSIDEINDFIINAYGEYNKPSPTLPQSLEYTRDYLLKVIKTPGDESRNLDKSLKNTFKPERLEIEFNKKERFETDSLFSSFVQADEQSKLNLVKYFNYDSLIRDEYIIIDSRYQNTTNTDKSKIVFNLQPNLKSSKSTSLNSQTQGGILIGTNIKDIVQIEISAFTIPYKPAFDNFYKKITLSINEWTTNSFQAYEDGAFHFMFNIDKIENNLIYLNPVDKVFRFIKPVNYIDNFTLSFGAMLPKIAFDEDRMSTSLIDYTSSDGIITFDSPHNLITGDLVYISNFTTLDSALDVNFINQINRSDGHIIVKKNNTSIIINMDFNEIRHADPPNSNIYPIDSFTQIIDVYFASKRIQIPLRIRHLIQTSPI